MHMYEGQRFTSGVFLNHSLLFLFVLLSHGLSLKLELIDFARLWPVSFRNHTVRFPLRWVISAWLFMWVLGL